MSHEDAPQNDGYSEQADFAEHRAHLDTMDGILKKVQLDADSRVLDVGGGQGMHACFLAARFKECWCSDIIDYQNLYEGEYYKLFREKCQRNDVIFSAQQLKFIESDAMQLLFRDDYFDFVTSFNAFEHIPEPARALDEMLRVTKPGGVIYITFDPIWTADTGSHFIHRVPEPWAQLILTQEEFIAQMLTSGANEQEIEDFKFGMNQKRLDHYDKVFESAKQRSDLEIIHEGSWSGLSAPLHKKHQNYKKAIELGYSENELMRRGFCYVLRKRGTRLDAQTV